MNVLNLRQFRCKFLLMEIKSLGHLTTLIFSRFSGNVTDHGEYTCIQTPTNPQFHWGNFIIFDRAPKAGDLTRWKKLFDHEFTYYSGPHHYTFAWDGRVGQGDVAEFVAAGFELETGVVLSTETLQPPQHLNREMTIKKIATDHDWHEVTELQIVCGDPKYALGYRPFKEAQMLQYRKMTEAGRGHWFGAYLNGRLVADLGIFHEGTLARYQSVGTHPDFRRLGLCGTLVYQAGLMAQKEFGVSQLVMEADDNYHAARIYESVGFQRTELNYSLSWWKRPEGELS